MTRAKQNIGNFGENIAAKYLTKNGFSVISRNFRSRYGEIDLIAKKSNKICFIEVKTRVGNAKGQPYESYRYFKSRSFKRAVQFYLLQNNFKDYKLSLDLISIVLNEKEEVIKLDYFENIDTIG